MTLTIHFYDNNHKCHKIVSFLYDSIYHTQKQTFFILNHKTHFIFLLFLYNMTKVIFTSIYCHEFVSRAIIFLEF